MKRAFSDYARSFTEDFDSRMAYMAAGVVLALGLAGTILCSRKEGIPETPGISVNEAWYTEPMARVARDVSKTGRPAVLVERFGDHPALKHLGLKKAIGMEKRYNVDGEDVWVGMK